MDDKELAERVAARDAVALEILVGLFYRPMFRFLWHATGCYEEAEDLTTEAIHRATADIGSFRGNGALRAWMFRVAHRELLKFRRKRAARNLFVPRQPESANPPNEDLIMLRAALQRLSLPHREAFLLVEVEGFSMDEAAAALHTPVGTVKSRCHHAKRQLRAFLAPAYPEVSSNVAPVPD